MLKSFNNTNVTNTKQFNAALSGVFTAISGRNVQIQELLIIALEQSTKGGNLGWVSDIYNLALETQGINSKRIHTYIKEYMYSGTVTFDVKKGVFKKSVKADSVIANIEVSETWFDFGKKDTPKKEKDYLKSITTAINNATSETKGHHTQAEILKSIVASGMTIDTMMGLLEGMIEE